MAETKKEETKGANGSAKTTTKVAPPAGFNVKVGREDGDGWVVKEKGNVVHGKLLGRFEFRDGKGQMRAFYQVMLQSECKASKKQEEGDEYDTFVAKPGQIVNLDEVAKISDLAEKCDDGGVYNVWMVFKDKIKRPGSNNTPWNFEGPFLEVIKPPTIRKSESPF